MSDFAPLGLIAFRCGPEELFATASDLWGRSTQVRSVDLAEKIVGHADWYEGMARTLNEIRGLPCCG